MVQKKQMPRLDRQKPKNTSGGTKREWLPIKSKPLTKLGTSRGGVKNPKAAQKEIRNKAGTRAGC